mgnify:CR=1 FL=1
MLLKDAIEEKKAENARAIKAFGGIRAKRLPRRKGTVVPHFYRFWDGAKRENMRKDGTIRD